MVGRNTEPKYPIDAISMLEADHQKVKELFARYESARDCNARQEVAEQIFAELETHARLEEDVFLPAYETYAGKKGTRLAAESRLEHESPRTHYRAAASRR